jgi:hypothetical protein
MQDYLESQWREGQKPTVEVEGGDFLLSVFCGWLAAIAHCRSVETMVRLRRPYIFLVEFIVPVEESTGLLIARKRQGWNTETK